MPDATIEFRIDDSYLEEFHGEWVATIGRGWRIGRRLTVALLVVGSVMLGASAATGARMPLLMGLSALALAAVNVAVRHREKARWLAIARDKYPVGSALRLLVENGRVRRDGSGEPEGAAATADLLDTPRGYFVHLTMTAATETGAEELKSSLYVPHRAVEPPMDRAAFRALFR